MRWELRTVCRGVKWCLQSLLFLWLCVMLQFFPPTWGVQGQVPLHRRTVEPAAVAGYSPKLPLVRLARLSHVYNHRAFMWDGLSSQTSSATYHYNNTHTHHMCDRGRHTVGVGGSNHLWHIQWNLSIEDRHSIVRFHRSNTQILCIIMRVMANLTRNTSTTLRWYKCACDWHTYNCPYTQREYRCTTPALMRTLSAVPTTSNCVQNHLWIRDTSLHRIAS